MQPIQFSESGIQMLLQNLKANKSPGPDEIHPLVLKHCSYELAPILKVIFTHSLNTGSILSDWLLTNITPVYIMFEDEWLSCKPRKVVWSCVSGVVSVLGGR